MISKPVFSITTTCTDENYAREIMQVKFLCKIIIFQPHHLTFCNHFVFSCFLLEYMN